MLLSRAAFNCAGIAVAGAMVVSCGCSRPSAPLAATPTLAPHVADRIDAFVHRAMARQHIAGLSLAVAQDGRILYARGYGYRNVAKRLPATPDTIYNLASDSKQFAAAAILLLQQDGKLDIDDKLARYLPDFPNADRITVHELLDHTSGLGDYLDLIDNTTLTPAKVRAAVYKVKLKFPPGSKYEYSNSNYIVAGMVVEKVSGTPFDDFLRRRILKPLDLRSTSVGTAPMDLPQGALGYTVARNRTVPTVQQTALQLDYPDGGINSTVLDLVKWDDALDSGRVVNKRLLKIMFTPSSHKTDWPGGYGLGLVISHMNGHREVFHTGEWTGFTGENATFPDDHFVTVILTNTDQLDKDPLVKHIFTLFYP